MTSPNTLRYRVLPAGLLIAVMTAGALMLAPLAAQDGANAASADAAWERGDYATALAIWQSGSEAGDAESQYRLAEAYRLGRGVARNLRTAEALYARAAAQGHIAASNNYGLMLYEGGRRDEAMPYIKAASERGDPRAQYVLGVSHYNGEGVIKDWVQAYALVSLADAAGLPQAGRARAQMDQFIPADARAQGLQLARRMEAARAPAPVRTVRPVPVAAPAPEATPVPKPATPVAVALPMPAPRPTPTPVPTRRATPSPTPTPSSIATADIPASTTRPQSAPVQVAPSPTPNPTATPRALPTPRATPTPKPRPPPVTQSRPVDATGPWVIQLGAFSNRANADRLWRSVSGNPALRGLNRVDGRKGSLYTLAAGGFRTAQAARAACTRYKASGRDCFVRQ